MPYADKAKNAAELQLRSLSNRAKDKPLVIKDTAYLWRR